MKLIPLVAFLSCALTLIAIILWQKLRAFKEALSKSSTGRFIISIFTWTGSAVNAHWQFIAQHWYLCVIVALCFYGYLALPAFQEFGYGILRFLVFWIAAIVLIRLFFKDTISKHINSGQIVKDFEALPSNQKVWLVFGTIAFVVYTAISSGIRP